MLRINIGPRAGPLRCIVGLGIFLTIFAGTAAAEPAPSSFTVLLQRARDQAAAGHAWTPAGNNALETITQMMAILPSATPQQLSEFEDVVKQVRVGADGILTPPQAAPHLDGVQEQVVPPADAASKPVVETAHASSHVVQPSPAPERQATQRDGGTEPLPLRPDVQVAARTLAPATASAATFSSRTLVPSVSRAPEPPAPAIPKVPEIAPYAAEMFVKGKEAEAQGDISGARRYYMIAAQAGLGPAALALGRLYDPAVLRRKTVGGIDPDPVRAKQWYDLADKLADRDDSSNHENVSVK